MYGTLSANLIGVALVMFFMVLMERRGITELRYFLLPGFCGGLTTFSAVTLQVVEPGEGGFIYLLVTVVASLVIAAISLNLSRKYIKVQA
jgi:CrcB protein